MSRRDAITDLDARGLKASQCKNGFTDLNRNGVASARATPQNRHDLAGQKAQFTESPGDSRIIASAQGLAQTDNGGAAVGGHLVKCAAGYRPSGGLQ